MSVYICLSHALGDLTEATRLADTLTAYGFRVRRLHEATELSARTRIIGGAAQLIALTSPEAHRVGSVAADLGRLPEHSRPPIVVCLADNPIDEHLCRDGETDPADDRHAVRIPYPAGETPDAQAVSLFLHRLLVRRLCRIKGAFSPSRCRKDAYGRTVSMAAAAEAGDRSAAYALGCAYERGDGVPMREEEAAAYITRAADAGLADAKLHLGELCLSGWGVEPDPERAFSLFASVAETGDMRGEYRLGLCYLNGVGVVTDPIRAVYHMRRAARWGYPPALFRLGLLCRDGIGTAADGREALRCLYDACRRGAASEAARSGKEPRPSDADRFFASLSAEEEADEASPVDPALLRALSDLTPAERNAPEETAAGPAYPLPPSLFGTRAARKGRCVSMRQLRPRLIARSKDPAGKPLSGQLRLFARSRYTSAHRPENTWIGSLTRSGHATAPGGGQASGHTGLYMDRDDVAMGVPFDLSEAAVALGGLLEHGSHPRPTRALVWYRYALRRGNTEALYRLADAYRRGHGTLADPAWAVVLYRLSADWGDARGQFALAVACEGGIGTPTDMVEAIRRYEQAARVGYAPAQNNLGGCYEYGIGVSRNLLTAVEWYVRAADAGLPEAMCRLGLCSECGRGVPPSVARALDLYEKAASLGNAYALYRLGVCEDRYTGGDRADHTYDTLPPEAMAVEDEPASERSARYAEAIRHWQAASARGVADADYALAMCYAHGHGVRRDADRAMVYLRRAAAGGCLQAEYRLGMCAFEGIGTLRSVPLALAHFQNAVRLWYARRPLYTVNPAPLPVCAYAPAEEAGSALYMLGYCTLAGIGDRSAALDPESRLSRAVSLFTEAAELGHVGASVALGDLYAYGRMPAEGAVSPAARAQKYYETAVLASATRRSVTPPLTGTDPDRERTVKRLSELSLPPVTFHDPRKGGLLASSADALSVNSSPALLSLALRAGERADACRAAGDDEGAARAHAEAWACFADAAEQGSADARVGMAESILCGRARRKDPEAAKRLLMAAETTPGGRAAASMWLGDLLRTGQCGPCLLEEADDAYLCGLQAVPVDSEVGPYVVSERKNARRDTEHRIRAALLYRLASFRSVYLSDKAHGVSDKAHGVSDKAHGVSGSEANTDAVGTVDRQETFSYLAEAVRLGHAAAREDLARMYDYERRYPAASAPPVHEMSKPRRSLFRRRKRPTAVTPAVRDHRAWLSDYYTALWPEPGVFTYELRSVATSSEKPPYVTAPVTPLMRADALYYLGECFFEGKGLVRDPAAAVACYREVVGMKLSVSRDEPTPASLVWSQYSLGWCLLHGEGTAKDPTEAIRWLTAASRTHAEACYTLGQCHERGIGVAADPREAVKYYRRALKLGYPAADKVDEMELLLRKRATDGD